MHFRARDPHAAKMLGLLFAIPSDETEEPLRLSINLLVGAAPLVLRAEEHHGLVPLLPIVLVPDLSDALHSKSCGNAAGVVLADEFRAVLHGAPAETRTVAHAVAQLMAAAGETTFQKRSDRKNLCGAAVTEERGTTIIEASTQREFRTLLPQIDGKQAVCFLAVAGCCCCQARPPEPRFQLFRNAVFCGIWEQQGVRVGCCSNIIFVHSISKKRLAQAPVKWRWSASDFFESNSTLLCVWERTTS